VQFGNWFWEFFGNSWSIFDLVIVIVSVLDAIYVLMEKAGNGLAVLRLLRIFRIVRIFNKLGESSSCDAHQYIDCYLTSSFLLNFLFLPIVNPSAFWALEAIYILLAKLV